MKNTNKSSTIFLRTIIVLLTSLLTTQFLVAQSWYDTNWSYRTAVIITNTGSALTDYQVKVSLDDTFSWSNVESDGADLRFTESDGTTEIDFWIESWTYSSTSAIIWVEVPSIAADPTATTIYLYYGNSSATGASSGVNTFDFFDGFDSGTNVNTEKWSYASGGMSNTSVAGGLLTMTVLQYGSGGKYVRIDGKSSFGTGFVGETSAQHPDAGTDNLVGEVGFVDTYELNIWNDFLRILDDFHDTDNWQSQTVIGGPSGETITSMGQESNTDWHIFKIYRNTDNTATFQIDDNDGEDDDTNIPTGALYPFLMSFSNKSGDTNTFIVDWTRVRKWADTDPTTGLGAQEELITWTGNEDTDWSDSYNWSPNQTPGSTSFVLIPDELNDPAISNLDPVIQDLTIDLSASLTLQSDRTLTINGVLINNGTLNLNSDATGIASLIFSSYTGSGTADCEMYLTGGGGPSYKWHYIAVPEDMGKSVFTAVEPYNLLQWDDSRIVDDKMQGWHWHDGWDGSTTVPADAWSTLVVKRGYNFYHSSDVSITLASVSSFLSSMGSSVGLQFNGDGLNLLGNSLTCSIDWDLVTTSGNMRDAIYFTKDNQMVSYVNGVGSPGGTTGIIPPLHGFFVKALATGASIDFTGVKTHGTVNRYKSKSIIPLIRLELQKDDQAKDETVIRFDSNATDTVDNKFDATKIFSESLNMPQIYTELNGEKYVINCINYPAESKSVPVTVKITEAGSYMIKRTQLQGLDNYDLTLTDTYENSTINLEEIGQYTFSSDVGTFTDRFIFTISTITTGLDDVTLDNKKFNIYTYSDNLNIAPLAPEWDNVKADVNVYDLTGRRIQSHAGMMWYTGETKQLGFARPKGIYIVEIVAGNNRVVQKISHR